MLVRVVLAGVDTGTANWLDTGGRPDLLTTARWFRPPEPPPIRSEIDPVPLMRKLAEKGAKLALPAVLSRGKSLAFRAWSPDDRLMLGPLGILEPSPAADLPKFATSPAAIAARTPDTPSPQF